MSEISRYLMDNYYSKYKGNNPLIKPDEATLEKSLLALVNNTIIIRDDKIKGIAIFLTLSDDTYNALGCLDISNPKSIGQMLTEEGDNIHFILLSADCYKTISDGIKEIKNKLKPKSISWWDPDMSRLHKYKIGG